MTTKCMELVEALKEKIIELKIENILSRIKRDNEGVTVEISPDEICNLVEEGIEEVLEEIDYIDQMKKEQIDDNKLKTRNENNV